jgi:hypothetical protein
LNRPPRPIEEITAEPEEFIGILTVGALHLPGISTLRPAVTPPLEAKK